MPAKKSRILTILFIILVAALGILLKLIPAFEGTWVSNNLAGLFYVTELALVIFLVFPGNPSFVYALAGFFLTSIIEFFQLWHPDFLISIRSTFIGHTIFGSCFSWLDFPLYLGGALLGWLLIRWFDPEK